MMNPSLALIRNKWAMLALGLGYLLLMWGVFLVVNHQEIALAELTHSPRSVHKDTVMKLYKSFKQKDSRIHEKVILMRLSEALIYQGNIAEAQDVSQQVLALDPLDHQWRFQFAILLHNTGMYEEAEQHFSILLKEQNDE